MAAVVQAVDCVYQNYYYYYYYIILLLYYYFYVLLESRWIEAGCSKHPEA